MQQIVVIEPGRQERNYWLDLWRYRELFQVLAWRDLSVRYKQTVIGIAWALIRPFLTMIVFTVIFSRLAKLPSDGTAPYALMVFAGIVGTDMGIRPFGYLTSMVATIGLWLTLAPAVGAISRVGKPAGKKS